MSTRSSLGAVALWVLGGVLAGSVAMVFVLSARIDESQELADTDSISALDAVVFAEAERRVVSGEVAFRATALSEDGTADVVVTASGIVTGVFAANGLAPLEFEVIVELNGRPLFPVVGAFAFYRGITFQDEGPDVTQLQELLVRAGADLEVDGIFRGKTQSALGDFYAARGYLVPTGADVSLGEGADQIVQSFVRSVEDSELAIDRVADELAKARQSAQPDQQQIEQLEIQRVDLHRHLERTLEALESARRDANEAHGEAGAALVPDEFWVVDDLPVFDEVVLQIGDTLGGDEVVLAQTRPSGSRLRGSPTLGDVALLEVGQPAHVEATNGEILVGTVDTVDLADGVANVEVVLDGVVLDNARSYEVIIPSDEEAVESLAVPVTAVNQRLGAEPFVVVIEDGKLVEIPVKAIVSSRGWTAILDPSGTLESGTRVVVGLDLVAN